MQLEGNQSIATAGGWYKSWNTCNLSSSSLCFHSIPHGCDTLGSLEPWPNTPRLPFLFIFFFFTFFRFPWCQMNRRILRKRFSRGKIFLFLFFDLAVTNCSFFTKPYFYRDFCDVTNLWFMPRSIWKITCRVRYFKIETCCRVKHQHWPGRMKKSKSFLFAPT